MPFKPISEMSLEELKSRENTLKKLTPIMAVAIIFMIATGAFVTFQEGFGVFTVLPIIFIGVFISNTTTLSNIRKEIAERNG